MEIRTEVEGRFILSVSKTPDGPKKVLADFKNTITNYGLNRLAAGTNNSPYCAVGSDSETPTVNTEKFTDLIAFSPRGFDTGVVAQIDQVTYATSNTRSVQFAKGAAAGNITVVGAATASLSTSYFLEYASRILDSEGNPTTITVLPDEYLTVSHILYLYPNLVDVTGVYEGTAYTIRPAYITNVDSTHWDPLDGLYLQTSVLYWHTSPNPLGPITGSPGGGVTFSGSGNTIVASTYIQDTFYRDISLSLSPAAGNRTIRTVYSSSYYNTLQCEFNPPFEKTADDSFSVVFRYSIARRNV